MSVRVADEAGKVLADPKAYTDEGKLHAALSHLRAHAPVSWVDVPDYQPFWAITKHADIVAIGKNPTDWIIEPRLAVFTREVPPLSLIHI